MKNSSIFESFTILKWRPSDIQLPLVATNQHKDSAGHAQHTIILTMIPARNLRKQKWNGQDWYGRFHHNHF
jgi:hypothetical protein